MIWHYIKLTLRKLSKNYVFTIINIGGLVIALACSFLIYLFVIHELKTDKFHKNRDQVYRVVSRSDWGAHPSSPYIMCEVIRELYPEIKEVTRVIDFSMFYGGQYIISNGDYISAPKFLITEQSFFDIFSLDIILGDKDNLINDINSLLISECMVEKLFQDKNPIGKTLRIKNYREERTFVISGVFKDLPSNSTIQANYIGSIELASFFYRPRKWGVSSTRTYIMLNEDVNVKQFEKKLEAFARKYHPEKSQVYKLQNFNDIYFKSDYFSYYYQPQGNYRMITILSIICALILLIACINYILISTAKSSERMIEIGMRMVMGANKSTFLGQVITESLVISLIAFPLAIILSELSLPVMNYLLDKEIVMDYFTDWTYLPGIFLITLIIGILSASYISFYITSYNPEQIFKKRFFSKQRKYDFRKVLIILQISVFIVLFIFSAVIILQLNHMNKKEIGYNTNNLICIYPPHDHDMFNCNAYVNEIITNPNVKGVSEVTAGLFTGVSSFDELSLQDDPESKLKYSFLVADKNYFETIDFQLVEGRLFDTNPVSDSFSIIINETAAKQFGNESPVGQILQNDSKVRYQVIGVCKDFHFNSLHNRIPQLAFKLKKTNEMISQIVVRINSNNIEEAIKFLEVSWDKYGPYGRFDYEFIGSKIEQQYVSDRKFADTIKLFTLITLLIAALGMFGFSFYNTRQKIKEIGIRKVFGASSNMIVKRILKNLLILIVIANIISWPFAYYFSINWLEKYAYHTGIPLWVFIMATLVTIIIVLITSGMIALNAAKKNPADSLRFE